MYETFSRERYKDKVGGRYPVFSEWSTIIQKNIHPHSNDSQTPFTGWSTPFQRKIIYHPQDNHSPSKNLFTLILNDGHPPFPGRSPTYHSKDVYQPSIGQFRPSTGWSPTISRDVFSGRSTTIQKDGHPHSK